LEAFDHRLSTFGSSGDLVRDFGAEGELFATKEDAIAVVFKAPKSSG
jgi:hypothetical protein